MLAAHHIDAEIGFTPQDCLKAFMRTKVQQSDSNFRIALVVQADHRRQKVECGSRNTRQGHPANLTFRELADIENRLIEIVQ
ncbi:hypothetical protein D9M71_642630 [compost metagenome]